MLLKLTKILLHEYFSNTKILRTKLTQITVHVFQRATVTLDEIMDFMQVGNMQDRANFLHISFKVAKSLPYPLIVVCRCHVLVNTTEGNLSVGLVLV